LEVRVVFGLLQTEEYAGAATLPHCLGEEIHRPFGRKAVDLQDAAVRLDFGGFTVDAEGAFSRHSPGLRRSQDG
jgi:hypothetical protein